MKRWCVWTGAVVVGMAVLAGCAGSGDVPKMQVPALGAGPSLMKSAKVMPGVGVGPVELGMSLERVRQVVGEPRVTKATPAGMAYSYPSEAVTIFGEDQGGVTRITCGTGFPGDVNGLREFWGKTPEGIGIGSTRTEVVKTYGTPEAGDALEDFNPRTHQGTLTYRELGISFLFTEDAVVRIHIFRAGKAGPPQAHANSR